MSFFVRFAPVVCPCLPSRVQQYMGEENPHVPAMQLWSYSSGTANLNDNDFEHLLFCPECQSLLNEFIAIVDELPSVNPNQAA
jgi:hypothetical protein